MKKAVAFTLLICVLLSLFTSCEKLGYYKVEVTGSDDSLTEPIKPYYKAGAEIEIRSHIATDVMLRVFVDGEEIPLSYSGKGYLAYKFIMPERNITVHLTYDRFYGRDEFSFDELAQIPPYLKNDLFKVCLKKTNAEKYSLIENRYSTKAEDIEAFKAIFDEKLIKIDNDTSTPEFYYEYFFFLDSIENGEDVRTIRFEDELYAWNDFSSSRNFRFKNQDYRLPTIENPDLITYSFKYDGSSSDVKKYDDPEYTLKYTNIGAVEFIPYNGIAADIDPEFYIDSRYGRIALFTETLFELDGKYYEIVSGGEYWAYNYIKTGF